MQLSVLAGREDAAQKLFAYNDLVMEMSGKINLTGIKDPEESLIKNVYDSLTVYEEKYFPENAKLLGILAQAPASPAYPLPSSGLTSRQSWQIPSRKNSPSSKTHARN